MSALAGCDTGAGLAVLLRRREFWLAFGLGLALQAGFMLALDDFAEARAHDYLQAVLRAA